jgi:universal stress protein E
MPNRRVLFAVRDPATASRSSLAKAIQVARGLGASLELFHVLTDTLIIDLSRFEHDAADSLRERVEREARAPLVRMCAIARKHGVDAECTVEWNYPPHEAIARRAEAICAELIVADRHQGARAFFITQTDFELLRISPVPVLLLKNTKPYRRPRVIAAVDPSHAHAKTAKLDSHILSAAERLANGLRGSLHIAHANYPSIVGLNVDAAAVQAATQWTVPSFTELQEQGRQAFEEFLADVEVPRRRTHLLEGNPAKVIPKLAKELKAGIVVMGAVSRSGLERVFIGNTAERVLNSLPCDVLVVRAVTRASPC